MKRKGCLFWMMIALSPFVIFFGGLKILDVNRVCISERRVLPEEELKLNAMRHLDIRFGNRDVARRYLRENPNCCRFFKSGEKVVEGGDGFEGWDYESYRFYLDVVTRRSETDEVIISSGGSIFLDSCGHSTSRWSRIF
jgi:hypothetical protein